MGSSPRAAFIVGTLLMKLCLPKLEMRPSEIALCFRFLILAAVPKINPQESSPTSISDKLTQ